jgi:hypothetical protein
VAPAPTSTSTTCARKDAAKARSSALTSTPPVPSPSLSSSFTPHPNTAPLPSSRPQTPHPPHHSLPRRCALHACLSELIGAGTDVAAGGWDRPGGGSLMFQWAGRWKGWMRYETTRQTHIQILATKNLSSRRYNHNHHRLSDSAKPTPTTA